MGSLRRGKRLRAATLLRQLDFAHVEADRLAEAHACVWGDDDAEVLLDWLRVSRRFRRESLLDAGDEAPLHGLVLLDLPDR